MAGRLFGIVLVVVNSFLLGNYYGSRMRQRLFDLEQMYLWLQLLKHEMEYQHATLPEALTHLQQHSQQRFYAWLHALMQMLSERSGTRMDAIWERALPQLRAHTAFTREDIGMIREFGKNLGYLSLPLQLDRIAYYMLRVEEQIRQLKQTVRERTRLYRTMGLLAGCFISLLLW